MPRLRLPVPLWSFAICLAAVLLPGKADAKDKIRVLCWSERTEPASVYPNGINGALAEMLSKDHDVIVKMANLYDPEQGLSEAALAKTDVLIWFGHEKHKDVTPQHVDYVVARMRAGMGFIALHSAHYALPFQHMMQAVAQEKGTPLPGTPGSWGKVIDQGKPETIHILEPGQAIVQRVKDFTIPRTETYETPFNVPTGERVLEGHYEGGRQDGADGIVWTLGSGKIFYFRPGHESYPIFYQPPVQRILRNAVHALAAKAT